MTSIDKLSYITSLLFSKIEDTEIDLSEEECDNIVNYSKDIRKELRQLEKLEKIIKEIKDTYDKNYDIAMAAWYKSIGLTKLLEVFNNDKH